MSDTAPTAEPGTAVTSVPGGAVTATVDPGSEVIRSVVPTTPGFVSASVHRAEDFHAMLDREAARPHLLEAASIAAHDPIVCRPVEVSVGLEEDHR